MDPYLIAFGQFFDKVLNRLIQYGLLNQEGARAIYNDGDRISKDFVNQLRASYGSEISEGIFTSQLEEYLKRYIEFVNRQRQQQPSYGGGGYGQQPGFNYGQAQQSNYGSYGQQSGFQMTQAPQPAYGGYSQQQGFQMPQAAPLGQQNWEPERAKSDLFNANHSPAPKPVPQPVIEQRPVQSPTENDILNDGVRLLIKDREFEQDNPLLSCNVKYWDRCKIKHINIGTEDNVKVYLTLEYNPNFLFESDLECYYFTKKLIEKYIKEENLPDNTKWFVVVNDIKRAQVVPMGRTAFKLISVPFIESLKNFSVEHNTLECFDIFMKTIRKLPENVLSLLTEKSLNATNMLLRAMYLSQDGTMNDELALDELDDFRLFFDTDYMNTPLMKALIGSNKKELFRSKLAHVLRTMFTVFSDWDKDCSEKLDDVLLFAGDMFLNGSDKTIAAEYIEAKDADRKEIAKAFYENNFIAAQGYQIAFTNARSYLQSVERARFVTRRVSPLDILILSSYVTKPMRLLYVKEDDVQTYYVSREPVGSPCRHVLVSGPSKLS